MGIGSSEFIKYGRRDFMAEVFEMNGTRDGDELRDGWHCVVWGDWTEDSDSSVPFPTYQKALSHISRKFGAARRRFGG
jgi:hypothetical protein